MESKDRLTLKQGTEVWLSCVVKGGMFPTERYVQVFIPEFTTTVSGFVPMEDVRDPKSAEEHTGQVRAVIAHSARDTTALLFRGEILSATNPVIVPSKWVLATKKLAGR